MLFKNFDHRHMFYDLFKHYLFSFLNYIFVNGNCSFLSEFLPLFRLGDNVVSVFDLEFVAFFLGRSYGV